MIKTIIGVFGLVLVGSIFLLLWLCGVIKEIERDEFNDKDK